MPLAEAGNVDIGVEGDTDARVWADELDLITLVRNLVDNAIRHTPPGGRIDLSARADEKRVTLQIDDTGPGIPPEERRRVFDPFYRVLGQREPGSGLGLSIVQTIAVRIGAQVDLAYSNPRTRSGLRVTVAFPAAECTRRST